MEEWTWLILAIGVLIAAVATGAAWRSAKATEKTGLAQILMQITDAYSSPEMLSGMLKLREWQTQHGQDWVKDFVDLRRSDYPKVKAEDEARRRYSHHFYKIWLLSDRGLVNESFVKRVASHEQVDFVLAVIEPLEKGINPNYDHSTFDTFRRIYRKES